MGAAEVKGQRSPALFKFQAHLLDLLQDFWLCSPPGGFVDQVQAPEGHRRRSEARGNVLVWMELKLRAVKVEVGSWVQSQRRDLQL